jgi:hypothetical protein
MELAIAFLHSVYAVMAAVDWHVVFHVARVILAILALAFLAREFAKLMKKYNKKLIGRGFLLFAGCYIAHEAIVIVEKLPLA